MLLVLMIPAMLHQSIKVEENKLDWNKYGSEDGGGKRIPAYIAM